MHFACKPCLSSHNAVSLAAMFRSHGGYCTFLCRASEVYRIYLARKGSSLFDNWDGTRDGGAKKAESSGLCMLLLLRRPSLGITSRCYSSTISLCF